MKLNEIIIRIINEEVQGIDHFLNQIFAEYPNSMSDEIKEFLIKSINESGCKNIRFAEFKFPAEGVAVHDGVTISVKTLNYPLEKLLFIIFHEIAHQYQFKKYGDDVMYNCYLGDISIDEAADFMINAEKVADEFAERKIRELQNKGILRASYIPVSPSKVNPPQLIKNMLSQLRQAIKMNNINSKEKLTEFLYNMIISKIR